MRLFFLSYLFLYSLFAIELKIAPDQNRSTISAQEAKALKYLIYKQLNFHLLEEGAKKLARENRALANQYLREYGLEKKDLNYFKVWIEKYLAEKFIKKKEEESIKDEKILLSYYLDHKEKFKWPDRVDTVILWFNNIDKAMDFYYRGQKIKDCEKLIKIATSMGARVEEMGYREVEKFKSPTRELLRKKDGSLLPPLIVSPTSVSLLCVRKYEPSKGYKNFQEALPDVKREFFKEAFTKMRREIVKRYETK
jgi:hypothetical protein